MKLPYPLNRLVDIFFPLLPILAGIAFGPFTFLHIILAERKPRLAFNYSYWRDLQFTHLWRVFSPMATKAALPMVTPLAGIANGVVLDIGPGDGQKVEHYNRQNLTKLYLVEPCRGLHQALRENLKKARLDDVATIIACGVEDRDALYAHGVTPSSVDTIVTFSVLCSVPAPEETCRFLYTLLKPGGQWLLAEHVLADQKYPLSRWIQGAYQVVWPTVLGGCNINRDSARYVREAGAWSRLEVGRGKDEFGWELLGSISGRLVKVE